ncbi:hypothetical protein K438DRAFT_1831293, partial [Mycena galopus ATCC 62051]
MSQQQPSSTRGRASTRAPPTATYQSTAASRSTRDSGNKENDGGSRHPVEQRQALLVNNSEVSSQYLTHAHFVCLTDNQKQQKQKAPAGASNAPDEYNNMPQLMDDPGSDDDDEESPVRGRPRRLSEKQLQLLEEAEAAATRKAEKADKAAKAAKNKKRQLQATGQEPEDDEDQEPRRDDVFASRTVDSRPSAVKKKALVQRNSKVAPTFPSNDWRETSPPGVSAGSAHHHEDRYRDSHHRSQHDHNDQRRHAHSPSPARFRGRSPLRPPRVPSPPPVR